MGKTKVVKYHDDSGRIKRSILPLDADDAEAPLGIPVAFLFPERYAPVSEELDAALAARGILTPEDLVKPGSDTLIRQAIQQVLRLDVHEIKAMNKEHDNGRQ